MTKTTWTYRLGDKVKVLKDSSKSFGHVGTVQYTDVPNAFLASVGVFVDNKMQYFSPEELEKV